MAVVVNTTEIPLTASDGPEEVRARQMRARAARRDAAIAILARAPLTEQQQLFLSRRLSEEWVLELLEFYHDHTIPKEAWLEWCAFAVKEGPRYPFAVRQHSRFRYDLSKEAP